MATELAKTAITAIAPEVAIPAEILSSLVRSEKKPSAKVEVHGDVVLIPPPEKSHLIVTRKMKVHVRTRQGIRIVTVEPERGLTTAETIAVVTIGAAAIGTYEAAKFVAGQVTGFEKGVSGAFSWMNPTTWKL